MEMVRIILFMIMVVLSNLVFKGLFSILVFVIYFNWLYFDIQLMKRWEL